jgi:hypothetical protein
MVFPIVILKVSVALLTPSATVTEETRLFAQLGMGYTLMTALVIS